MRLLPPARVALGVLTLAVGLRVVGSAQAPVNGVPAPVLVHATVTDKDGRFVTDLSKDDFILLDKSKTQTILDCRHDDRPITLILMLDRSGSLTRAVDRVNAVAQQVIDELAPADRARITQFSDRFTIGPAYFTTDHAALTTIVRQGVTGNATRLWDAVDASVAAVETAAGHRAVLLMTDGDDTGSKRNRKQVTERAQDASITVHAIGLWTIMLGSASPPDRELKNAVDETGGEFLPLRPTDDIAPAAARVIAGMRAGYLLAFAPTTFDGKRHKLEVRVTRPGMQVQASHAYLAAPR